MDMDEDFAFALQLSVAMDDESKDSHNSDSKKPLSVVDPSWELLDPIPDIRQLFIQFDKEYFAGQLACVEVKWSARMTLCAGLCRYEGRGGLCCINLSQPLLKLRPRSDLVNTLLHEMIHALLFVTDNNKDHDGHGPEFHKHMYRINKESGSNITVYHSFHDEVNEYRQHWWKCEGPCSKRRPFYGMVRRAMNRAPGPNDKWWANHQKTCGGVFKKIREPDKPDNKKKKNDKNEQKSPKKVQKPNSRNIGDYMKKKENKTGQDSEQKVNIMNGVLTKKSNITGFNSLGEKDSNSIQTFSGSSKNASSNIHGFKMTARKDNNSKEDNSIDGKAGTLKVEGTGKKLSETSSFGSRETYLKRLEMDIAKNQGTKRLNAVGAIPNKAQKQFKPNGEESRFIRPVKEPHKITPDKESGFIRPVKQPHKTSPGKGSGIIRPVKQPHKTSPDKQSIIIRPVNLPHKTSPGKGSGIIRPVKQPHNTSPGKGSGIIRPVKQPHKTSPDKQSVIIRPVNLPHKTSPGKGSGIIRPVKQPHNTSPAKDNMQSKQRDIHSFQSTNKVENTGKSKILSDEVICIDDSADDELLSSIDIGFLDDSFKNERPELSGFKMIDCPACPAKIFEHKLNEHLDICLVMG